MSDIPAPDPAVIESARYVLVGRALPALRHALVGELQALKFGTSLARGCCLAHKDDTEVLAAIARVDEAAGRCITRAHALSAWLQPDPDLESQLLRAVDDCLDLVRTEWRIRGIEVVARTAGGDTPLRVWPFRELLTVLLFAFGDSIATPSDVTLIVRRRPENVLIGLRARTALRDADGPRADWPRPLVWQDVDALVRTHAASCQHRAGRAVMRIPA